MIGGKATMNATNHNLRLDQPSNNFYKAIREKKKEEIGKKKLPNFPISIFPVNATIVAQIVSCPLA